MKKKEVETPKEYLTNDLTELKKAALVNLDIDLLKDLSRYMENSKGYTVYYARMSENVIRNRAGEEIDLKSLPFPRSEISMHYWEVEVPYLIDRYEKLQNKPGDLHRAVRHRSDLDKEDKTIIKEVPDSVEFPLPLEFDWEKVCIEYCQEFEPQSDTKNRNHRFSGRGKHKTYYWIATNGAKMMTGQKPASGIEYTVTESW